MAKFAITFVTRGLSFGAWPERLTGMTSSFMTIAILLMLGSLIPGVGAFFAVFGVGLFAASAVVNVYADKFQFSPYERAKRDFDASEITDLESENFIANEKELEKVMERDNALKNEIKDMIKDPAEGGNSVANRFAKLYNENSAAYHNGDETEKENRFDDLLSTSGLEERQDMMKEIASLSESRRTVALSISGDLRMWTFR